MKTEFKTNIKDQLAAIAILFCVVATALTAATLSTNAHANYQATPLATAIMETITVTADRMPTAKMEVIVVVASRQ